MSLKMDYVSNLADVQVGDVVVSRGWTASIRAGLVIGEVVAAERGAGLYRQIRVKPAVDFSALEEVLVVVEPPAPAATARPASAASPGRRGTGLGRAGASHRPDADGGADAADGVRAR